MEAGQSFLYSIYGSADSGAMGVETVASIAAREPPTNHQALAEEIRVIFQSERRLQQLEFDLKLKGGVPLTEAAEDFLYRALCETLFRIRFEFESIDHESHNHQGLA